MIPKMTFFIILLTQTVEIISTALPTAAPTIQRIDINTINERKKNLHLKITSLKNKFEEIFIEDIHKISYENDTTPQRPQSFKDKYEKKSNRIKELKEKENISPEEKKELSLLNAQKKQYETWYAKESAKHEKERELITKKDTRASMSAEQKEEQQLRKQTKAKKLTAEKKANDTEWSKIISTAIITAFENQFSPNKTKELFDDMVEFNFGKYSIEEQNRILNESQQAESLPPETSTPNTTEEMQDSKILLSQEELNKTITFEANAYLSFFAQYTKNKTKEIKIKDYRGEKAKHQIQNIFLQRLYDATTFNKIKEMTGILKIVTLKKNNQEKIEQFNKQKEKEADQNENEKKYKLIFVYFFNALYTMLTQSKKESLTEVEKKAKTTAEFILDIYEVKQYVQQALVIIKKELTKPNQTFEKLKTTKNSDNKIYTQFTSLIEKTANQFVAKNVPFFTSLKHLDEEFLSKAIKEFSEKYKLINLYTEETENKENKPKKEDTQKKILEKGIISLEKSLEKIKNEYNKNKTGSEKEIETTSEELKTKTEKIEDAINTAKEELSTLEKQTKQGKEKNNSPAKRILIQPTIGKMTISEFLKNKEKLQIYPSLVNMCERFKDNDEKINTTMTLHQAIKIIFEFINYFKPTEDKEKYNAREERKMSLKERQKRAEMMLKEQNIKGREQRLEKRTRQEISDQDIKKEEISDDKKLNNSQELASSSQDNIPNKEINKLKNSDDKKLNNSQELASSSQDNIRKKEINTLQNEKVKQILNERKNNRTKNEHKDPKIEMLLNQRKNNPNIEIKIDQKTQEKIEKEMSKI